MQRKLTETTAFPATAIGGTPGHKLFRVPSGPFAGRQVALFKISGGELKLAFADAPYLSWSSLVTVATDCADGNFDAAMEVTGNLYVVYPEVSTWYLVSRKLTFTAGGWSAGDKVTVYNGAQAYDPSLAIEPSGKLWVAWSRLSSPNRYVHVKGSTDGGTTWGNGAADAGDSLSSGGPQVVAKVLVGSNDLFVIYATVNAGVAARSLPLGGGTWSSEYWIATGISGFGENFDAAVGPDGRLAVVFNDAQFRYREFDGSNWGALVTLEATPQYSPQLLFRDSIPVVIYATSFAGSQTVVKFTERRNGTFTAPVQLDPRAGLFESVQVFNQTSGSYGNITAAAANSSAGDLFHPASGCLLKEPGDALYLGMSRPFRYAELLLATPGAGGAVSASYWDGNHWVGFTPANGVTYLDAADVRLLLFADYGSLPADWQERTVNGVKKFWIKLEATTSFVAGPVGSQISAISAIQRLIIRR